MSQYERAPAAEALLAGLEWGLDETISNQCCDVLWKWTCCKYFGRHVKSNVGPPFRTYLFTLPRWVGFGRVASDITANGTPIYLTAQSAHKHDTTATSTLGR